MTVEDFLEALYRALHEWENTEWRVVTVEEIMEKVGRPLLEYEIADAERDVPVGIPAPPWRAARLVPRRVSPPVHRIPWYTSGFT